VTISEVLKMDAAFSLVMLEGGLLVIEGPWQKIPMPALSPKMKAVLEMLFVDGATQDDLVRALIQSDGPAAIPQFLMLLQYLQRLAILCRTLYLDDQPLATVVPIGSDGSLPQTRLDRKAHYALSRFVVSRVDAGGIILESPLSHFQIRLHHRLASHIVFELRTFRSCEDLAAEVADGDFTYVSPFLEMLERAGMLSRQQEGGVDPETNSYPASGWEFHDLLFHTRSRRGRHRAPYGGTFRFVNQSVPPPPALKAAMSEELIPLDRPDMAHLELSDPSFTAVLEGRRTLRQQGDTALTRQQLGHFLYRSARVRKVIHTPQGDFSQRPYPAGGALYELEIYPVVARCEGLDSGLYQYGPLDHVLSRISGITPELGRLLEEARYTWDQTVQTQILLVITTRFPRIHWKYQSLSYALSLKNLGALYQTMYLVATAMGLAPCALGGGDSDLFARIAGLDYLAEGSIGEFALGSAPTIRPSLISNTYGRSSSRRPDVSSAS
jgi:oxazoline/thiazoline dehydrogenase